MTGCSTWAAAACTVVLLAAESAQPSSASEIFVPVSVAMRGAVAEVAATFEKQTGHTVKIWAAAPGQITASLEGGGPADVVVQIDSALPAVEDKGLVAKGRTALGTTGFGIATRAGDPATDIATPAALKSALLGAARVVYNDPAVTPSGKLLLSIADKLGIAAEVKAKSEVVGPGRNVEVMAKATDGGPVVALAVLVEISGVEGAKTVGPLPPEFQVALPYSAVLGAKPTNVAAAKAFLAALAGPEARQAYAKAGFAVKD